MKKLATFVCAAALVVAVSVVGAQARSPISPRAASFSGLDKQYLTTSMQGDLFEVAGGRIALRLSGNKAVRDLAKALIKDHAQSFKDSAKLARGLGVEVPKAPTMTMVWELKIVSSLRGKTFNHWYASLEAADHEQDIAETTDEVKDGSNSDVVLGAKHELPTLNRHLKLAREALRANP
jgi:putative membrane protein